MDSLNCAMGALLTQETLSSYFGLVSLSDLPLVLLDGGGHILYEFVPLPEFCKQACLSASGAQAPPCLACACAAGEAWDRSGCPHGLSSFAVPLTCGGAPAGYLAGGYAFEEDQAYRKYMQDVPALARRAEVPPEAIARALSLLRVVSREKLAAHVQLGQYIANHLLQKLQGMKPPAQSVEKDILERTMIEQEARDSVIGMKPDFLFNMLNCIARIAYFERAEKTETLIYHLSDLLRYNMDTGTTLHTVQAELEHIEKYLFIQKARFQARLKYELDVPDYIRSCHILNAVLLPLVDNALVHGIMLRKDGGEIHLRARSSGDRLIFLILDNGSGFPAQVLQRLREPAAAPRTSLQKIDRRLKRYYGAAYGLEIVKSDASGSTVSVTVPRNMIKKR